MKYLITGACGFIGSHFARMMSGENITLLDKDGYFLRLKGVERMILRRDISIEKDVRGVLKGIDVLVHFAAETFVDYSISNPRKFLDSNIIGTFNLLEEARKNRLNKIVIISTDEVYGSIAEGYAKESHILNPGNPYSATKAAVDMIALSYKNTFGLPIHILRCENNYGTYQGKEKAIPTWISKILQNQPIPVYGDGKHKRMWLRVEDFCSAIHTVIERGTETIYNVGDAQEFENLDIIRKILSILKKEENISFIPDAKARPGHDRRYAVDSCKIRSLGWKPKYRLESSLEEIVNWYVKNQWWLYGKS